jgi:hypothetical protein
MGTALSVRTRSVLFCLKRAMIRSWQVGEGPLVNENVVLRINRHSYRLEVLGFEVEQGLSLSM